MIVEPIKLKLIFVGPAVHSEEPLFDPIYERKEKKILRNKNLDSVGVQVTLESVIS